MRCERDFEREREMETIEFRSRRLKALVEEWTAAIDEVRAEPLLNSETISEFEKTLPMTASKSKRSH